MLRHLTAAAATAALCVGAAQAATLVGVTGAFYDARVADTDEAIAFAEANEADATFVSTGIDYPNGALGSFSSGSSLADFLGADAASLVGGEGRTLDDSVIVLSGQIRLDGTETTFSVGSDDGFALLIGGDLIAQALTPRGFEFTGAEPGLAAGLYAFTLVFFENTPNLTGLEFRVDGEIVGAEAAVPLPAGAVLLLTGLGGVAAARRRSAR